MNGRGRTVAALLVSLFFVGVAVADTLTLKDGRVLRGRYLGGTQAVLRFEIKGDVQAFNVTDVVGVTFTPNSGDRNTPPAAPDATPPPAADPPPAPDNPPPASDNPPQGANAPVPNAPDAPRPVQSRDVPPQPTQAVQPAQPVQPATPAPPPPVATPAQDPAAQYGEITVPAGQALLVRMMDGVDSKKNQVGDVFHASLETDLYINNTLIAHKGTDVYGQLAEVKEA